jgi:hypothetical protein
MRGKGEEKLIRAMVSFLFIGLMAACSPQPVDYPARLIGNLKSSDAAVRSQAARDLGLHDEPRVHEALLAAAADPSPVARAGVFEALGRLKIRRALPFLLSGLKDRSANVRAKAATALGQIGDAQALEPLLAALSDPEPEVRDNAIWALGSFRDGRALDALLKLNETQSANSMVYYGALGRIGDPRAIAPIIAAVKRTDDFWAAAALKEIGPPAFAALVAELNTADADTRGRLTACLLRGGPTAIRFLMGLAKSGSAAERKTSGWVLQGVGRWYPDDPVKGEVDALLADAFAARDLPLIAGASSYFIMKGEKGSENILGEALRLNGDREMATIYLNCDNGKLILAAYEWARRHGYGTMRASGGAAAKWGEGK